MHFNGSKFGGVLENFLSLPNFGVKNAKRTFLERNEIKMQRLQICLAILKKTSKIWFFLNSRDFILFS